MSRTNWNFTFALSYAALAALALAGVTDPTASKAPLVGVNTAYSLDDGR